MAVHGTRNRESVSWDYAGVLEVLRNVARDHTGLPLLRCYWYEATVEGRRSSEHEILAGLPGVKLRLGKMKPGRREGVESEIHRDLTTLARNRAISDALVVSAEEDLAQVIADVQDLGLRVILVHIAAPGWTAATALRQECDEIVEISEAHLRPSVELVVGAEPAGEEERQAVPAYASRAPANGHGTPGVIGQPAVPVGSHAAPPGLYTGPVIAEYQRAAQPANSHRPPLANASGTASPGNHSLASAPGPQPGMAPPPGAVSQPGTGHGGTGQPGAPGPRDFSVQPGLPPASFQAGRKPGPTQQASRQPAPRPAPGRAVRTGRPAGAARPDRSAGPACGPARAPRGTGKPPCRAAAARSAGPADDASGPADDASGPASARTRSGTRIRAATAPPPAAPPQHAQLLPRGMRAARGPAVGASRVRARARPARPAASAVHARAADGRTGHAGTACARAARCPGGSARVPGARQPARLPGPTGTPRHARLPGSPSASTSATRAGPGSPGGAGPVGRPARVSRPGRGRGARAGSSRAEAADIRCPAGPGPGPAARRGSGRPSGPPRPAASRCAWRIPGGTARPPARRGGRSADEAVPSGAAGPARALRSAAGAAQWPAACRAARPGAAAGGGVPGRRGAGSARRGFQLRPGRRPGRAGALAGGRARPQAADAFRPRSQAVAGFLAAH